MNQKIKITKYIIEKLQLISPSERSFKAWVHVIWQNPRLKEKGGLRLTERGFNLLVKAEIKCHDVRLDDKELIFDNKFILWLDNYFNCPFYLTKRKIYIFDDKTAVQLILFSGDLQKCYLSYQQSLETEN